MHNMVMMLHPALFAQSVSVAQGWRPTLETSAAGEMCRFLLWQLCSCVNSAASRLSASHESLHVLGLELAPRLELAIEQQDALISPTDP